MGIVYRAKDTVLDTEVALKVLHDDTQEQSVVRFQREAKTSSKLNHPHIAKTIDFAQTDEGKSYLVMEFVEGTSLKDLMEQDRKLKLSDSLELFEQIASAMAHAHGKGILHRDLKPSNVIVNVLDDSYTIKIVDFGLAKPVQEGTVTQTKLCVGSPLYMSPEQIKSSGVSEKSDIYSFGCLMFYVLTKSVPHRGESTMETFELHLNEPAPLVSKRSSKEFPPMLEKLVASCLEKDPGQRPDSFKSIVEVLDSIANGAKPNPGTSQSVPVESESFSDSKRYFFLSAIALTFIVAIAGLYLFNPGKLDNKAGKIASKPIHEKKKTERTEDLFVTKMASKFRIEPKDPQKVKIVKLNDSDMPALKSFIAANPFVTKLSFTLCDLSSTGLKEIVDFNKVQKISFRNSTLTKGCYPWIAKMTGITYLNLSKVEDISVANIEAITSLPKLQVLVLSDTGIGDSHLRAVKHIKTLFRLDLSSGVDISANGLEELLPLKRLRRLNIDSKYSGPEFLSLYPKFKRLKILKFEQAENLKPGVVKELTKKMPGCSVRKEFSNTGTEYKEFFKKSF